MIVCVCRVVTDRDVRDAVQAGAETVAEVGMRCGAGTGCGNCRRSVAQIVDEEARAGQRRPRPCKKAA